MDRPFLGRGWAFPIQPDGLGRLAYTETDANIEHSLKVLLLTSMGERVMRRDFGCDAEKLVFAPGSRRYMGLLETTVRDAVRDWEPRIEIEDVLVEALSDDPSQVTISIAYRVRQTNTRANLVFPYYLGVLEPK